MSKIPLKCKDPGSFTVPCAIGNASYEKALCDLGASVSLMPYDIFKKLEIGDLKPTRVVLSMADKSLKYPLGVVEDVPTRVGKFVFPADFIVVDMEVDEDIPILFGRPFLATVGAIIDMKRGKITLELKNGKVEFDVYKAMKDAYPFEHVNSFGTIELPDIIDDCVHEVVYECIGMDDMDICLNGGDNGSSYIPNDIVECTKLLDSNPYVPTSRFSYFEPLRKCGEHEQSKVSNSPFELKPLPSTLRYEFLDSSKFKPFIIDSSLSNEHLVKLIDVLKKHDGILGYSISDLKGLHPSLCMHRIILEEDAKPY